MHFQVSHDGVTMDCCLFRRSLHGQMVLTGTVNGVCRMETNVHALRRLSEVAFKARLVATALDRLKQINAEVR